MTAPFFTDSQIDAGTPQGKLRISVAATGALPFLAIFGASRFLRRTQRLRDSRKVTGTPPRKFFGAIWAAVVVLWAWVTVVVAFYMQWQYLCAYLALHVAVVIALVGWLWVYERSGDSQRSVWVLGAAMLLILMMGALLLVAPMSNVPPDHEESETEESDTEMLEANARASVVFPWVVPVAWIIFAFVTGYLQAQRAA